MSEVSPLDKPIPKIPLNITIDKEEGLFIARCEVLDICTGNKDFEEVKKDIVNLIKAYVQFAVKHDNWDVLFDFNLTMKE